MEYKKAIAILISLLERKSLEDKEKEAIMTAIGILDWASLSKNRIKGQIKARKTKRDKSIEW